MIKVCSKDAHHSLKLTIAKWETTSHVDKKHDDAWRSTKNLEMLRRSLENSGINHPAFQCAITGVLKAISRCDRAPMSLEELYLNFLLTLFCVLIRKREHFLVWKH